jgi:hypothetical protein
MSIAFVEQADGASVKPLTTITHATIRPTVAPSP